MSLADAILTGDVKVRRTVRMNLSELQARGLEDVEAYEAVRRVLRENDPDGDGYFDEQAGEWVVVNCSPLTASVCTAFAMGGLPAAMKALDLTAPRGTLEP